VGLPGARLARGGLAWVQPTRIRLPRTGLALARLALTGLARTVLTWLRPPRVLLPRTGLRPARLALSGLVLSRLVPARPELARSVRPPPRRIFVTCWHDDPARRTCSILALRIGP